MIVLKIIVVYLQGLQSLVHHRLQRDSNCKCRTLRHLLGRCLLFERARYVDHDLCDQLRGRGILFTTYTRGRRSGPWSGAKNLYWKLLPLVDTAIVVMLIQTDLIFDKYSSDDIEEEKRGSF